jgi:hypothetical protein
MIVVAITECGGLWIADLLTSYGHVSRKPIKRHGERRRL